MWATWDSWDSTTLPRPAPTAALGPGPGRDPSPRPLTAGVGGCGSREEGSIHVDRPPSRVELHPSFPRGIPVPRDTTDNGVHARTVV